MQSFEWVDAESVEQAVSLLGEGSERAPVMAKAGGMDLLDLMKGGVVSPRRVVNLKTIKGLDGVRFDAKQGLELGTLVTLSRVSREPEVRRRFVALAEAAEHAATPQVRNAATLGGNLLQRPRCWYFRNEYFHQVEGNEVERVREGQNQYHAIFDNQRTVMVHASTPATALVAYGASVELSGPGGKTRVVPVSDFLLPPDMKRPSDTVIAPNEVLTRVRIPAPGAGTKAAYYKQGERESYDWPICDVAVVLQMDGQVVRQAAIALGWVAPTPRRAAEAEKLLVGKKLDEELARQAAKAAVSGATPLSKNAYKVPILEAVIRRTVIAAAKA
ncbi:aromatic aldehyde oxidoreductase FAD-binding subunit [Cystobacter fuscus]|uniref:Aromatic aldehyde oxidoreductase FAD-binding subunit n=1 Tax=Cystobacter fuscus TaxID=43 RepID=A0A250JCU5_9BACT|nr:FAD binding domain-containing protein [Cystobacter fuscus]ATB41734.1 aromatic aldehyde oxidoreductase FAD-binding subunit [Cystobacter fuscus]